MITIKAGALQCGVRFVGIILACLITSSGCGEGIKSLSAEGKSSGRETDSAVPSLVSRQVATWKHWKSLAPIMNKMEMNSAAMNNIKNQDDGYKALKDGANLFYNISAEISGLSVLNVEPEVVGFSAECADLMTQSALLYSEFADYTLDASSYVKNANSFGVGLESFIRGFLGEPLAVYHEQKAEIKRLEERRIKFVERLSSLGQKAGKLTSLEIQLRSTISGRFNKELPPLQFK